MKLPTIEQFEAGEIDGRSFGHEAHLYLAWCYLQQEELLQAISRYRAALQRLTRRLGAEAKYHETITWIYLVAIAERLEARPDADWAGFRRANPDLFEPVPRWLGGYYSPGRLASAQARRRFVLPDRAPGSRADTTAR